MTTDPMYPPNSGMPAPMGPLDELLDFGDQSSVPVKVFVGHNLGARTFLICLPMHDFYRMSDVANEAGEHGEPVTQRKLDPAHAQKLAAYMLRGLVAAAINRREMQKKPVPQSFVLVQDQLGKQPYLSMQPIVANLRSCKPLGANIPGERLMTPSGETASFRVMLSQRDVLWVVDGQHRRKGMDLVFEFLDHVRHNQRYPKRNSLMPRESDAIDFSEMQLWNECYDVARSFCTVAVELHLGLDYSQERQLFHDLNNLGKKVERSLALVFDSSNPVNTFIKDEVQALVRLSEHDIKNWADDDGSLPYKDVVAINAHLFLNKSNIAGAPPLLVEARKEVARRWWEAVVAIPHLGEPLAKHKTVAAQPVVLKAIAKLAFDFAFGRRQSDEHLNLLLDNITDVDFSHDNPMWRFYELSDQARTNYGLGGLYTYLPSDEDGKNRDIGSFQGGFMRFGAKHNDIYPLIGDMIRWKLGLPSRSPFMMMSSQRA
jgi:hypothetical protein